MKFKEIEMIFLNFFKDGLKIDKLNLQFIHSSQNFCYIF